MELIDIKNVTMKYGSFKAVDNISLSVKACQFFCLVGCNGSGKTTLIKGILGLLPLQNGSIDWGVDWAQVAYVPQADTIMPNFPTNCKEIILSGRQNSARLFYTKQDNEACLDIMQWLRLESLAKKQYSNISGGQKQTVLLARALIKKPKLLILDEPASALDEQAAHNLYAILSELTKEGAGILMVSHDLSNVKSYASQVAVLNHSLQFLGTIEQWQEYRKKGGGEHFDGEV